MALPKFDLEQVHQPQTQKARFRHPDVGFLEYEPMTMRIKPTADQMDRVKHPINLAGVTDSNGNSFVGTPQPFVKTCTQPMAGNAGCPKWAGCPFKALPHVGPVAMRVRYDDDVNYGMCYDYYEALDERGRPISQNHMGMDGWKVALDGTTHPILSNVPVGKDPITGKVFTQKQTWNREIPNLGPPWWPQMAKKGLPLPRSAELYPELAQVEDECGKESSAPSEPSVSRSGRGKRTTRTSRRKRSGTASTKPALGVESSD